MKNKKLDIFKWKEEIKRRYDVKRLSLSVIHSHVTTNGNSCSKMRLFYVDDDYVICEVSYLLRNLESVTMNKKFEYIGRAQIWDYLYHHFSELKRVRGE